MPIPLKIILWIIGVFLVIVIIGIIVRVVFYFPSFDLVEDQSDTDTIITKIEEDTLETTYSARLNERIHMRGITITPRTLLEDSRCPVGVECIQAGTVRLKVELTNEVRNDTLIFSLGETITTEVGGITLVEVEPDPVATDAVDPSTYTFLFRIE
jgi:hypothetical protein